MKAKLPYIGITVLFLAELATVASHARVLEAAPVIFWILAGPAAFRLARTVSFNKVGEWIRDPWCEVTPDGSGAGDTVNPKPGSAVGELLACPICTGTHAAMILLAVYAWLPAAGLALAAGAGIAGVSEMLHWTAEVIEWRGHLAREETGRVIRSRRYEEAAIQEVQARKEANSEIKKRMQAQVEQEMRNAFFFGSREK